MMRSFYRLKVWYSCKCWSIFKPSLSEELGLSDNLEELINEGTQVACIEIMWRGELQRRFFMFLRYVMC